MGRAVDRIGVSLCLIPIQLGARRRDVGSSDSREPLQILERDRLFAHAQRRDLIEKRGRVDQTERVLSVQVGRQTFDFALADDVKVRTNFLPVERDEKGKAKRLTPEEKHKLKGDDPKLPGYTAELSGLSRGQVVEVHLSRLKGTTPKKPAAGEKDKSVAKDKATPKDKGKDADKSIDRDLLVTMIVIMSEGPAGRPNGK